MRKRGLTILAFAALLAVAGCNNTGGGLFGNNSGGGLFGSSGSSTAPAASGCATTLHQNLPGGSDYTGPPVPGCGG